MTNHSSPVTASTLLTEIIAYFSTSKENPGDAWAHPDDFSSYGLDYQSRDGTKLWIDLEQEGTIMVLWKPSGQEKPTIQRFSAHAQTQPSREPGHRITVEGNCIVDDHDRRTIAKFELWNGSTEELQAIVERSNLPAQQQQEPVSWRWRPRGATLWIYNPEARWVAANRDDFDVEVEPLYVAPAQCARADIAKAIAYDLENGSAHGARVVTTPHLDNYHVTGHVNLLALADAVLALSSTDGGGT